MSVKNIKLIVMNKRFLKQALFLAVLLGFGLMADAQKRSTKKRATTKKATTKKAATKKEEVAAAATAQPQGYNYDSLPVKQPIVSYEVDNVIERLLVKDRTPLAYEHIREDDAVYKQRIWRDIDVREKINQTFVYAAEEESGSQKFIDILLNAIQKDSNVHAYNALDDRFTRRMTKKELTTLLVGGGRWERIPDRDKDPDGSKGIFKDTFLVDDFNSNAITKFRLKEEWVFDKESSRMFVRILGIAPIQVDTVTVPGTVLDKVLFWVYYPKLRATLAKHEAYNGKNYGARPTWEELFESRMFSSYIVKSTLDNPKDLYLDQIPGLKENGILRLWEGENIKTRIFDYEQNLWSY
jgi:gliding motility associated protien GldN